MNYVLNLILFSKFQCLNLTEEQLKTRIVEEMDIAFDDLTNEKHYKESEDPKIFKSIKTSKIFEYINKNKK